jgi:hypothetical protein
MPTTPSRPWRKTKALPVPSLLSLVAPPNPYIALNCLLPSLTLSLRLEGAVGGGVGRVEMSDKGADYTTMAAA